MTAESHGIGGLLLAMMSLSRDNVWALLESCLELNWLIY